MKLLLVNQHYPPDPAPTGTLLAELARTLAARGHDVTVLTGRPTYGECRGESAPPRETRDGVHVVRLPLLPRRNGALSRLAHYASFAVSLFFAGLRAPRPDALLAFSSTPLVGGITALALSRARGVPFVYSVQDVHPDIAVALGVLRPGVAARAARMLEDATWRSAARLVVIGREIASLAASRGVAGERIEVIANWADLARIRPLDSSAVRREAGVEPDAFVVEYAGNFGRSQDLESILEAARLVEGDAAAKGATKRAGAESGAARPIRFLFVGGGARAEELRARARDAANVRILPYQPEDRVADVLAAADLSLVPLQRGLTRFSVPSKIYSILASGRPVGACLDAGSDVARIIAEADCGFRVDPGDPGALAEQIRRFSRDRERAERCGKNAREWSERCGGLERAARAYESLLTRVAS